MTQTIRPGTTTIWETWVVVRKNDLPERLKHSHGDYGTREEARGEIRRLKAAGTPGLFGVRHEMTVKHSDPAEWLEETLVPVRDRGAA